MTDVSWEPGQPAGWPGGPDAAPPDDIGDVFRPRWRPPIWLVVTVAVVLLAVGLGAWRVVSALDGGGRQPETLVPADAVGYIELDLDPAASQKLAVRGLARRFPKPTDLHGFLDDVLRPLLSLRGIDYDKDVRPWLGHRVAIAVVPYADEYAVVFVLQTEDEKRARASLRRIARGVGTVVGNGYAVITPDAASLGKLAQVTDATSFARAPTYLADLATIGGNQLATTWLDLPAMAEFLGSRGVVLGASGDVSGRAIFGVHAVDDAIQMDGRLLGGLPVAAPLIAPTLLPRLPEGTVAAVSLANADRSAVRFADALNAIAQAIGGDRFGDVVGRVPTDLLPPISGLEAVLAVGQLPVLGQPLHIGLVSQVAAVQLADRAAAQLRGIALRNRLSLRARRLGTTLYLGLGTGWVDRLVSDEGLGDTPGFRATLGTLGPEVTFAAYVDLTLVTATYIGKPEYPTLAPLQAAGVVGGVVDGTPFVRVRLTFR